MKHPPQTGHRGMMPDESQESMEQPGPEADSPDGEGVSLQDQEQYNRFVSRAKEFIAEDEVMPALIGRMKSVKDPVEALSVAASSVFLRVLAAAAKAGQKVPGDVLLAAGEEVFSDIAQLAEKAGIHDFMSDDDAYNKAWIRVVDRVRVNAQASGLLDLDAAKQDMAFLKQADDNGMLGDVIGVKASDLPKGPQGDMPRGKMGGRGMMAAMEARDG